MKKNYKKLNFSFCFTLAISVFLIAMSACGGNSSTKSEDQKANVDGADFYATQPVHSGLFDADYYDITGTNARKGRFDGRIYFSLSPETSAFYVFENGNRTKIDYIVSLQKPFEKGDSGIYYSVDKQDRPVTISTDSTMYVLGFQRPGEDLKITFNPKARHEGSALEILEKMAAQKNKK